MSVHLYNLGADMSISTGVDRLGKVVFWVSVLGVSGMNLLLALGNTDNRFSIWLGVATLITVGATVMDIDKGMKKISAWWASIILWYNLLVIAWVVNQLPKADIVVTLIVYAVPVASITLICWIGGLRAPRIYPKKLNIAAHGLLFFARYSYI